MNITLTKYLTSLVAGATALTIVTSASGAVITFDLGGTSTYDQWTTDGLTASTNPGYPGFPGTGAWPAPIGSTLGADATLNKTANGTGGGPYPAGGSIYYGGFSSAVNNNGGTLTVSDATPVAGLQTVVFQLMIGEAWTYDLYNGVLPTLSLTHSGGTTTGLMATYSSLFDQDFTGTITMPSGEEPLYNNTYGLQWDTSSFSDISELSVSFTGVQHAQLYELQLDQSDLAQSGSVLPAAVPEPTTTILMAAAGLMLVVKRRSRGMGRSEQKHLLAET